MECWVVSQSKSWVYRSLMLMMINILMVGQTQGDCIVEERKALLEIKASHMKSYDSEIDDFLPTWVDYGSSTPGDGGSDCCDWERVNCNTTTGHVIELSLYNLRGMVDENMELGIQLWPLNVSLFLHFRELTSLNLSYDFLDKLEIMKTGLERLSSLKKLEILDLSLNYDIDNDILPSLSTLTSLKILDLSHTGLNGNYPISALENLEVLSLSFCYFNITFEIQELAHLINLKKLDLSNTWYLGTPNIQDCKSLSRMKRLESINLSGNSFNKSIISCLTALPSLKILDLSYSTSLGTSFPVQEFNDLRDLEVLLRRNGFSGTLPMEAFASFHHLEILDLSENSFVGSIPSTIQGLSSLRVLSFAENSLNGSLSDDGFCESQNLQELDLSNNMLHGSLPQCFDSLTSLKLLDISSNQFSGILPPSLIANLTSVEYIDFSHNNFEGSFSFSSFSNHKKLEVVRFRSDNDIFEVETEEPIDWIPMFQLKILELSNCNMKMPKGRIIPGFLLHQHNLRQVDMSHNSLEGQLPNWLIRNNSNLEVLILRDNLFGGMPLHMNANMKWLDVSQNHMIGLIPDWLTNMSSLSELVVRNNSLEGRFPCGAAFFSFLDISQNSFSGPIPSCSNLQYMEHLHLGSNRFTGSIPNFFRNLTNVLTLDIGNNLSGRIPKFLGELSNLRILLLRKNNFNGFIPRQLCQLSNMSFIDLSANSFSGSIPSCLHNITGPSDLVFLKRSKSLYSYDSSYHYESIIWGLRTIFLGGEALGIQDEVQYTTKSLFLRYKGGILDYMTGLDLSNNKLTGEIPEEVGFLTQLRALNLSHNQLIGLIPVSFSNLAKIESLDLSSNGLTNTIPSELIKLTSLSIFNVSHNSLSGRLPEMKSQFGTFTEESYEGNPLLCGPPLEKKCTTNPQVTNPSAEEDHEKWYDIDMTYFYGSSSSTCFVFLLGFVAILYTNPRWRRRWLDWVEDCIYTCYYFLYDLVWKPSMIFCR
ncbi:unnamed protein product [Lactuca saligna]|uniref:Leucine-rich repeat-containing N-terminal plant-type domain-containing protein n=1 Tax=Lactuca saligna TaxID=75948 RepID=A0AA35UZA7_LACSI|nr:unnamed protein product [Lactuca saligna]